MKETASQYIIAVLSFACFVGLLILIGALSLSGVKVPEQLWTMSTLALGGVLGSSAATAQYRKAKTPAGK